MATLTIDLISGKVFLFNRDFGGGGTGGTGGTGSTYMEVNLFSELPSAAANNGEIYVVRESSGNYVLNRKEAGLYYSNGIVWRRLGDIPSFFNSDNFQVYDGSDNTKGIEFVTSGITSNTFRQLTVQDSDGTIAYLTDLDGKVDTTAFADYTGTTAPNTFVSISAFTGYSATTLSLINTKQVQLIAGDGINLTSGGTISVKLPDSLQLKDVSGGTEVNTVPQTPIGWTTEEYSGTSLNFSGGSRIYIEEDGDFIISYNLNYRLQSGGRKTIGTAIRLTGGTLITPTSSASYVRNTSNLAGANAMPDYKVNLNNGDYIELVAFRVGDSGSATTLANGSWIKITKIL
jgi:hypothetical protein